MLQRLAHLGAELVVDGHRPHVTADVLHVGQAVHHACSEMATCLETSRLAANQAGWLLGQQRSDGSWENDQGLVHEQSWSNLGNAQLPVTAYVVWALTEAGYVGEDVTANVRTVRAIPLRLRAGGETPPGQ